MMGRVIITGATGYIGTHLAWRARERGCEVVTLGSRSPLRSVVNVPWRLGQTPPREEIAGADAIIHLAHEWSADVRDGATAGNVNLAGTETLLRAALEAGVPRIIFASTTSARAEARNTYGRLKHMIEKRVLALPGGAGRVACARIALVYGGLEYGQYGMMVKLVELTPILPMIGLDRRVQPIDINEVCDGLLRLAVQPPSDQAIFVLASPQAVTWGEWLRLLRQVRVGKGIMLLPVPTGVALLAADLIRLMSFGKISMRERVLGLVSAAPMDSAADIAALGIEILPPATRLTASPRARRRFIAEAAAMLSYIAGRPIRSRSAIVRLARVLARDFAFSPGLPKLALRWPGVLRTFEPLRPSKSHSLSRRLQLAAMVLESMEAKEPPAPGFLAVAAQLLLEGLMIPARLVLGRVYA